jgi:hypothetical protein
MSMESTVRNATKRHPPQTCNALNGWTFDSLVRPSKAEARPGGLPLQALQDRSKTELLPRRSIQLQNQKLLNQPNVQH